MRKSELWAKVVFFRADIMSEDNKHLFSLALMSQLYYRSQNIGMQ